MGVFGCTLDPHPKVSPVQRASRLASSNKKIVVNYWELLGIFGNYWEYQRFTHICPAQNCGYQLSTIIYKLMYISRNPRNTRNIVELQVFKA
jgi:hypothetical protein